MKQFKTDVQQAGVALILSLLILLMLTVIGVAAMNSTIMQERMAGNARTQADVFEASSEGVTRSLELFYDHGGDFTFGKYDLACGQVFGDTIAEDPASSEAWAYPSSTGWHLTKDGNPKLEQRMYCCRNWFEGVDDSGNALWIENPSKLFVLNRATFMGGADSTESLAMRDIEVELAESDPDDPTCAICAPGDIGTVDGAKSNAFRVNGACGAAIVADGIGNAETFISGIPEKRRDNYDGGVVGTGDLGSPWNDPLALAEFVFWTKLGLEEPTRDYPTGSPYTGHAAEGEARGKYWGDDEAIPTDFDTAELLHPDCTDAETCEIPLIHYVEGDVKMKGNAEGYGIMIVNGTLEFSGTPEYKGLIVSLGGSLAVGGGGNGEPEGSFVFTSLKNSGAAGPPADLYGQEVLHYQALRGADDEEVVVYNEADYDTSSDVRKATGTGSIGSGAADEVPPRPVLVDNTGRELIHYATGDATEPHRFFNASDGSEVSESVTLGVNGNFEFRDGGGTVVADLLYQSEPTRDAFGRMIPDFVLTDNYPEEYGYNPNNWHWQPDSPPFEWGSTDFSWSGGGNEAFTYDCRQLQRIKHQLLCDSPSESSLPSDPNDPFFEETDHSDYCEHAVAEELYGDPTPGPAIKNQKAWHLWGPSCDCLGISVETDMIVSGWRENLGWRDTESDFEGCAGLPSPADGS